MTHYTSVEFQFKATPQNNAQFGGLQLQFISPSGILWSPRIPVGNIAAWKSISIPLSQFVATGTPDLNNIQSVAWTIVDGGTGTLMLKEAYVSMEKSLSVGIDGWFSRYSDSPIQRIDETTQNFAIQFTKGSNQERKFEKNFSYPLNLQAIYNDYGYLEIPIKGDILNSIHFGEIKVRLLTSNGNYFESPEFKIGRSTEWNFLRVPLRFFTLIGAADWANIKTIEYLSSSTETGRFFVGNAMVYSSLNRTIDTMEFNPMKRWTPDPAVTLVDVGVNSPDHQLGLIRSASGTVNLGITQVFDRMKDFSQIAERKGWFSLMVLNPSTNPRDIGVRIVLENLSGGFVQSNLILLGSQSGFQELVIPLREMNLYNGFQWDQVKSVRIVTETGTGSGAYLIFDQLQIHTAPQIKINESPLKIFGLLGLDVIDGEITSKIQILSQTVNGNEDKVVLRLIDSSGNIKDTVRYFEIIP